MVTFGCIVLFAAKNGPVFKKQKCFNVFKAMFSQRRDQKRSWDVHFKTLFNLTPMNSPNKILDRGFDI